MTSPLEHTVSEVHASAFDDVLFSKLIKTVSIFPQTHFFSGFTLNKVILERNINYRDMLLYEMTASQKEHLYDAMVAMHAKYLVPIARSSADFGIGKRIDAYLSTLPLGERLMTYLVGFPFVRKPLKERTRGVLLMARRMALLNASEFVTLSGAVLHPPYQIRDPFVDGSWDACSQQLDHVLSVEASRQKFLEFYRAADTIIFSHPELLAAARSYRDTFGLGVKKKSRLLRKMYRHRCAEILKDELAVRYFDITPFIKKVFG